MLKDFYKKISVLLCVSLLFSSSNAFAGITFYDEDEGTEVEVKETKKTKGIDLDAIIEAEEKKEENDNKNNDVIKVELKEATEAETTKNDTVEEENISYLHTDDEEETQQGFQAVIKVEPEKKVNELKEEENRQIEEVDLHKQQIEQLEKQKEEYKQKFQDYYDKYTAATINHDAEYCYNGVWINEANNWYFYLENAQKLKESWLNFNNNMYWLDSFGAMTIGFKFIGDHWYYFNRDGKRHAGWLQYNDNIKYYFEPVNGWMIQSPTYIEGQYCIFAEDGRLIEDNTEEDIVRLVQGIMQKIKYVNNSDDRTESHAEAWFRDYIRKILQWMPKNVLQILYEDKNLEKIYFCMEQDKLENRPYIWRVSYTSGDEYVNDSGRTVKERITEDIPFQYSEGAKTLTLTGSNPETLFFGIGHILAYKIRANGDRALYKDPNWEALFRDQEEKDILVSYSGDRGLVSCVGRADVCLATAIGWYFINIVSFQENCPGYCKYITQRIKPGGYNENGPSTKSNADLFVEAIEDEEQLKKIRVMPTASGELPELSPEEIAKKKLQSGENWICSNPDCMKININDGDYCRYCGWKKGSTKKYYPDEYGRLN